VAIESFLDSTDVSREGGDLVLQFGDSGIEILQLDRQT
jgi:hypothetical protein